MKILILLVLLTGPAAAQNSFRCLVLDSLTRESLPGVTGLVRGTNLGAASGNDGLLVISRIPDGPHVVMISSVGYTPVSFPVAFPQKKSDTVFIVLLHPSENELSAVTILSTRTNSRIEEMPTRIEVLGADELTEESGIKPGSAASLLGDIAGIQIQQTSATTGNAEIRIQGLDGKYTQSLYDGIPLFSGFSGSFGLLQVPPLDLKQIEIIKGSSSTLYGGGAISGLVNYISKTPLTGRSERNILVNVTSLLETDVNVFFSGRNRQYGYTFFGGATAQPYRDVDKDGFSDVPRAFTVNLHPTAYFYLPQNGLLRIGLVSNYVDQKGGDVAVLQDHPDSAHAFFVKNRSWRNSLGVLYQQSASAGSGWTARANLSWFTRDIGTNHFTMLADQWTVFSEANHLWVFPKDKLVAGINLNGDFFNILRADSIRFGDSHSVTPGLFLQNEWTASKFFILEAGLRADYNTTYGLFILPRLNALFRIFPSLTARIGGGFGYSTPDNYLNSFQEQDYPRILPLPTDIRPERSAGMNLDINFSKQISEAVRLTVNQSFFYTRIGSPMVSYSGNDGNIAFRNEEKPLTTDGSETYVRMELTGRFDIYLGYVFTNARKTYDSISTYMDLTARHKASAMVMWEASRSWSLGIESSYIGRQYTSDYQEKPDYFMLAAMIRFSAGKWRFVLNGENLLDYRQSKVEPVVLPPYTNPVFSPLWAPIDGRVINLSATLSL